MVSHSHLTTDIFGLNITTAPLLIQCMLRHLFNNFTLLLVQSSKLLIMIHHDMFFLGNYQFCYHSPTKLITTIKLIIYVYM